VSDEAIFSSALVDEHSSVAHEHEEAATTAMSNASVVALAIKGSRNIKEPAVSLRMIVPVSLKDKYKIVRQQPKSPEEEEALARKYADIESLEQRAYAILKDLGMLELTKDEKSYN
jgi:ADP-ribosylglycohydrolase